MLMETLTAMVCIFISWIFSTHLARTKRDEGDLVYLGAGMPFSIKAANSTITLRHLAKIFNAQCRYPDR